VAHQRAAPVLLQHAGTGRGATARSALPRAPAPRLEVDVVVAVHVRRFEHLLQRLGGQLQLHRLRAGGKVCQRQPAAWARARRMRCLEHAAAAVDHVAHLKR
jgi:hypothetical protein